MPSPSHKGQQPQLRLQYRSKQNNKVNPRSVKGTRQMNIQTCDFQIFKMKDKKERTQMDDDGEQAHYNWNDDG